MKKPIALFCADLHLRVDTPYCRTDDYLDSQETKLRFIKSLANKYDIPLVCAGDLFHKSTTRRFLEVQVINILKDIRRLYIIPGNHDLINHSLEMFYDSSIGVINAAFDNMNDVMVSIDGFKYSGELTLDGKRIAIIHEYVHAPKQKDDNIEGYSVEQLFKKLPDYDIILTGDNHTTFTAKSKDGRLLINPGSMMRMNTKQVDHKPCVFIWYGDCDCDFECVYLPIKENVIDTSHITVQNEKDERVNAFIERINDDYELSLSFQDNIKNYLKTNKTRPAIEEIVWRCVDEN